MALGSRRPAPGARLTSIVALTFLAVTAQAATPLPYFEMPGDTTTTDCDVQWLNECEIGWSGIGGSGTLDVLDAVEAPMSVIAIVPGGSTANGISRAFDVTGAPHLRVAFPAFRIGGSVGDTVDIKVRAIFKNATGVVLATYEEIETVDTPTRVLLSEPVPLGAVVVELLVLAENATSSVALAGVGLNLSPFAAGSGPTVSPSADDGGCQSYTNIADPDTCTAECPEGQFPQPTHSIQIDDCTWKYFCACMDDRGFPEPEPAQSLSAWT